MVTLHNLGFPRIGPKRELKFALESYWKGQSSLDALQSIGADIRRRNWSAQSGLDHVPVGDFSFYDQVLDMSFTLGHLPERVWGFHGDPMDNYFRVARGRSAPTKDSTEAHAGCCNGVAAGEMTKWFDTNYHYIVPEFTADTTFALDPSRILSQIGEARAQGISAKPVIIGPVTYLYLGKSKDRSDKLALLDRLLPVYAQLLDLLSAEGIEWIQIDEPILVTTLTPDWTHALNLAYHHLKACRVKILLATYFGELLENSYLAANLPVAGIHIDATTSRDGVTQMLNLLPDHKILSLGVVSGRNIWKTDLAATLDWLEPIASRLGNRLWIAPSGSLLHVPVDLDTEQHLDPEIKSWLAFAIQKLDEIRLLGEALRKGRDHVREMLDSNQRAILGRRNSPKVTLPEVQAALNRITNNIGQRQSPYPVRAEKQRKRLRLPLFPTTTIGSFPQTPEIRQARGDFKAGRITEDSYRASMRQEIARSVLEQEALGLDVLVHGEAERNDMVEYFGEQLEGYAFSQHGWVQSYGSRCVKPPILFGDISRPHPMTLEWITFAQSLTFKPMKGMLTGPVTILNWSFVRDDQPRSVTCRQLALAIRNEVLDLERAGIKIIQIDEAALREGLPLRKSAWDDYLEWAVSCFRIAANGVGDETQIHTHMCYSEFNDIISSIVDMDADVITIETSRSDMELLDAFDDYRYPNEIGPGVYDIHTPNIPTVEHMVMSMNKAADRIPVERLWINPDCGLKTRQWPEVRQALSNMITAATCMRTSVREPITT